MNFFTKDIFFLSTPDMNNSERSSVFVKGAYTLKKSVVAQLFFLAGS